MKFFNDAFDSLKLLRRKRKPPTLERQFTNTVLLIKERNSQIVWSHYYVPLAVKEILRTLKKDESVLSAADNKRVEYMANSLMFRDMADGKLNEFYQFEKE